MRSRAEPLVRSSSSLKPNLSASFRRRPLLCYSVMCDLSIFAGLTLDWSIPPFHLTNSVRSLRSAHQHLKCCLLPTLARRAPVSNSHSRICSLTLVAGWTRTRWSVESPSAHSRSRHENSRTIHEFAYIDAYTTTWYSGIEKGSHDSQL
jgi:hypothetical protein